MSLTAGPFRAGWWPLCALLVASPSPASDLTPPAVRDHADQTFQHLQMQGRAQSPTNAAQATPAQATSSAEELLTGEGQGDLSKGKLVCQRVSELAARADIAKQIRVLVKEHATDRLRERLRHVEKGQWRGERHQRNRSAARFHPTLDAISTHGTSACDLDLGIGASRRSRGLTARTRRG